MRTITLFFSFIFFASSSIANPFEVNEDIQTDPDQQSFSAKSTNPYDLWLDYLSNNKLSDGVNTIGSKRFIIAYGEAVVNKPLTSKDFFDSRDKAHSAAVLMAKSELANTLSVELKSNRALELFEGGNEAAGPLRSQIQEPLSIMDKANTLTDLALDNQIKKFDPQWDGTGKSKNDKVTKIVEQRSRYTESLSRKSRLFLQGTTPIFSAEGPNDDGKYTVVVGLVWSAKSTRLAESMYNPTVKPPTNSRKLLTIREQINNLPEEVLASSMGVRIFWDEKGKPALVSFASTRGSGNPMIAKKKTGLRAQTQMAQFISENIVSSDTLEGDETADTFTDGTDSVFNNDVFQSKIIAKSKTVNLNGVSTIMYKKIRHPASKKLMALNVMTWTPNASKLAREFYSESQNQETRFDATKGGRIFNQNSGGQNNGIVAPGSEGVSTSPSDF